MADLYPLKLEPQVKEVVWGGRWLATELGRPGQPDAKLGESWEAYSGSLVTNGAWAGRKLSELFEEYGAELLGQAAMSYPKFPLLVKFIDAHDNLSVQVHPDDKLAQQLENYPFGKTEFWYVMTAEPGAEICYSLNNEATSREQLQEAISQQELLRFLKRAEVQAGDVVFIPAGTVHALTKGIVVYELQQDCDITYRLYDWGRVGRPIHIEKGLQAINLDYRNLAITHPPLVGHEGYGVARLVECPYFVSDRLEIAKEATIQATPGSFTLLSAISGSGTLRDPASAFAPQELHKGDTLLIPAGLPYTLTNTSGGEPLKVISGSLV